jgi:iron(III) transport system substrate-binding protein
MLARINVYNSRLCNIFATCMFVLSLGCVPQPEDAVVVYSAADREYATPILDGFGRRFRETQVVSQFDVESTKTVGLANRIKAEAGRPRCDLFWNNEIMHTLALEKQGLLRSIRWDLPGGWPKEMYSPQGNWVGIAARARVLIVNKQLLEDQQQWPMSVVELADPKWRGRCGVARPLFGTTATHFTVLANQLGPDQSLRLFKSIGDNAVVLSGNKQVAQQVAAGKLAWGLTDTDDALIEIDSGMPVEIVYPDQQPDQPGTLRIPNTVAVIAGSPHPAAAQALANYLISQDTEGRLAMGVSGQFPIRPDHPVQSRARLDRQGNKLSIRWMSVDFQAAADHWEATAKQLDQIFR